MCSDIRKCYHIVKPFYSTHLQFLKKVSAITKCQLYKRFYVIFTGSKFHEFRVFCAILRKLVSAKIIAKSVITHLMFKYRSVSNKNIWKLNNSLFLFSLKNYVVSAINILIWLEIFTWYQKTVSPITIFRSESDRYKGFFYESLALIRLVLRKNFHYYKVLII